MKRLSESIASSNNVPSINGFAILKPGFKEYEKELDALFNNNYWKIVQKQNRKFNLDQAKLLYLPHKDKDFYDDLCKYMTSDECVCYSCYKDCKDPIKDMNNIKEKVRKQWGEDEMKNCMHSSDSLENVERETKICIEGCVNESYLDEFYPPKETDVKALILEELISLYAEEINAFYQYWAVLEWLKGPERSAITKSYFKFALDELQDHASKLQKRIAQLNDEVGMVTADLYSLNNLAKAKYIVPDPAMITESSILQNIDAETLAIGHYRQVVELTKDVDPVTHDLVKHILADEEAHKQELEDFLADIVATKRSVVDNPMKVQADPVPVTTHTELPW